MEKEELREHLTTRATWIRGLYMLLFALIYSLAELVLVAVVLFQFIARLVTGEVNERLQEFGQQLSRYFYDMLRFFTFNSEEKPYPFAPWNKGEAPDAPVAESAPAAAPKAPAKKKAATKKRAVAKRRAAPKQAPAEEASPPESTEATTDTEAPSGEGEDKTPPT